MKKMLLVCGLIGLMGLPLTAAEAIALPSPDKQGGMPLMEALNARKTSRRTKGDAPTMQQLANVLWAANGVSRADGKRTAPSAMNRQEIEIAVLTAEGLFTWSPKDNTLTHVETAVDLADQLNSASILLIFTYDKTVQPAAYAQVDCGFVGQNVYLYCTSAGWDGVFLGSINRKKLAQALGCDEAEVLHGMRIGVR